MLKSILVHVDSRDPASADRIRLASDLARQCHGTLTGMAAALPDATVELLASGRAAIVGGVRVDPQDDLAERFAADRAQFLRLTAEEPTLTEWQTAVSFPAQGLLSAATRADLIVVGQGGPPSATPSYLNCADLVLGAGRPVLAVPEGIERLDGAGAVVAWRNTREARRALADALPLLSLLTAGVNVVHVREANEDSDNSRDDAVAWLAAHGVAAVSTIINAGPEPAPEIVRLAEHDRANLIVSGAYGHTRLREWVLGGVTRQLMRSNFTCLFSH